MLRKIMSLIRWGRITKAGSDDKQFAVQQVQYLGKTADCLIVFPYGIHGNVPADALALMLSVQGNPDNRAAIAWTPKIRPQLAGGEVAYYHPPTGTIIKLDKDGNILMTTGNDADGDMTVNLKNKTVNASGDVTVIAGGDINAEAAGSATVKAPTITLDGNVVITGTTSMQGAAAALANMAVTGTMLNNGTNIGSTHVHVQGVDSNGDTQQNTGAPS